MADQKVDLKIEGITGERLIRRGDETELYQAVQKQFGRKVAVKVYTAEGVRDTALERFERECALMGELSSHPNVVTYFKSGIRRRRPYVVSEWLDQGTFFNAVTRGDRLDWADAANLGVKIAGALESAHRLGLLHRKLKPQDLYLTDDAKALWIAFYNEIERQQGNGSELEGARPFASKAAEHAARIAGIITLVEDPKATQIPSAAMDAAIELTVFYLTEHLRLTGAGRQERIDGRLRTLLAWLQSGVKLVQKKDVLQKSPYALRKLKADGLAPLIEELVTRGYIRDAGKAWEVRSV